MVNAIAVSTSRLGRSTTPSTARVSVSEWATVKAVTMPAVSSNTARSAVAGRK